VYLAGAEMAPRAFAPHAAAALPGMAPGAPAPRCVPRPAPPLVLSGHAASLTPY
jgi:hypothetical protein